MGNWPWAYGAAVTTAAVALGMLVTEDQRTVGVGLLVAAILLVFVGTLPVRARLAEASGQARTTWWWWNVRRQHRALDRRDGPRSRGVAIASSSAVPPRGSKVAEVAVEVHHMTTLGRGNQWIPLSTQARALYFTRPVKRRVKAGIRNYELLSWRGRFTIGKIMPSGFWLDDHRIVDVRIDFEVEPVRISPRAKRRTPRRSGLDHSSLPEPHGSEGAG